MKKTVAAVMALIMVLCLGANALAEKEFPLHNGILFGDSLDTVKAKEEGKVTIQDGSKEKTNKVWFSGTIAGAKGSVRFDFDESTGGLTDMLYTFNDMPTTKECDARYNELRDGLIRKYGDPIGNTGGTIEVVTGLAFEYAATLMNLYESMKIGTGDLRSYDEWIIDCDGYFVKIDLVSYYIKASDTDYKVNLSYHYYTGEQNQNKQDLVDKDL